MANVPRGGAYFSLQARGADIYIVVNATSAATGITAADNSIGFKITNGTSADFWIDPTETNVHHIATGACTLYWWQSGPNPGNRP